MDSSVNQLDIGWIVMALGAVAVMFSWIQYRKEGVGFWSLVPIWKANDALDSPGPQIWYVGFVVTLVGLVVLSV